MFRFVWWCHSRSCSCRVGVGNAIPVTAAALGCQERPGSSILHRTAGEMPVDADWFDSDSLKTRGDTASQNRSSLSAVATTGPRAEPFGLSASGSAMGSTFPSATRPCVGGSRAMPSSASRAAPPGPGSSCIATLVRMSMIWSTSTVAPIAVCPRRSCTELDTSRTAPVAATPGTRQPSRGIALTLKRPSKPWLASLLLAWISE